MLLPISNKLYDVRYKYLPSIKKKEMRAFEKFNDIIM